MIGECIMSFRIPNIASPEYKIIFQVRSNEIPTYAVYACCCLPYRARPSVCALSAAAFEEKNIAIGERNAVEKNQMGWSES